MKIQFILPTHSLRKEVDLISLILHSSFQIEETEKQSVYNKLLRIRIMLIARPITVQHFLKFFYFTLKLTWIFVH